VPPSIRASDREREAVAARLRLAAAEGRLEADEFEERVQRAFAARTQAELIELTQDLPATRHRAEIPRRGELWPRRVGAYIVGNALLVSVWMAEVGAKDPLVLGESEFPWPVLSIVAWGGALGVSRWRERRRRFIAARRQHAFASE